MNEGIYIVRDMQVGAIAAGPFRCKNNAQAVRMFSDAADDKNGLFYKHPAHFCLMRIGSIDSESCLITDHNNETLCIAADFVKGE